MKRIPRFLKNKYVLATSIFLIYSLFLDENDLFTIVSEKQRLNKLEQMKAETEEKLHTTNLTLKRLKHLSEVERYAREKKFFKKDDEDVFVIFYE